MAPPGPRRISFELLLERSNGIPLHVEELVGATAPGAPTELTAMPDTLRDAILHRRAALSDLAMDVANTAAVIGRSFELEAVAAVAERTLDAVALGVDELLEREFIAAAGQGWYDFRHALIREALEGAAPLASRRQLHARAAAAAADRPGMGGAAVRSAHYEAACDHDAAHTQAVLAAERAVSVSNHREALALYHRAVRCAPADLADEALAGLLVARATEAAATDDNAAAAADYARARALFLRTGRVIEAADVLPSLVAARHLLGDSLGERLEFLEQGLADLSSAQLPAERTASVRARLHAGISNAYMLDRRLDESITHGEQAIALADMVGDDVTELDTCTTVGSVLLFASQSDTGWARLEDAVRRGRLRRWERESARAYRMIGTSASVLVEYDLAERWLPEGIDYAERTEQWNGPPDDRARPLRSPNGRWLTAAAG